MVAFATEAPAFEILAFGELVVRGTLDGVDGDFDTLTVGTCLRSSNYSAGAAGFTINADGSIEANDITIRADGEFNGTVTIDTLGGTSIDFEYDGDPVASFTTAPAGVSLASSASQLEIGADAILSSQGDVTLDPDGYVVIASIPTANPGGSGRLWSNGGVVQIT